MVLPPIFAAWVGAQSWPIPIDGLLYIGRFSAPGGQEPSGPFGPAWTNRSPGGDSDAPDDADEPEDFGKSDESDDLDGSLTIPGTSCLACKTSPCIRFSRPG